MTVVRLPRAGRSVEEQWDIPAPGGDAGEPNSSSRLPVGEWLKRGARARRRRHCASGSATIADAAYARQGRAGRHRAACASSNAAVMLQTLDTHWREHLAALDHLRQGIHLRGYAQKNPKQEYKREAFELFSDMLDAIKQDVVKIVLTVQVRSRGRRAGGRAETRGQQRPVPARRLRRGAGRQRRRRCRHRRWRSPPPFVRAGEKVGRNDPCPCGSGKKYKHCHGRLG